MVLMIDNYDSFTYNLTDYLWQVGVPCTILRNDAPLDQLCDDRFDAVVLSPGPETPRKAGKLMSALDYYAFRKPILGICLGHQAIGEYFGAELVKANKPMHGKLSSIDVDTKSVLFDGLPSMFQVVRYHSLIIKNLPRTLKALAYAPNGELMAMQHVTLPIHSVQFHPEAILTEHGLAIMQNWSRFYRLGDKTK